MKNITLNSAFSKKAFAYSLALFTCFNASAQINNEQLAFPGAEGWGRYATGGRAIDSNIGSNIYHVTTLEEDRKSVV